MNKMRKKLSMVVLGVVLVMALSVTCYGIERNCLCFLCMGFL